MSKQLYVHNTTSRALDHYFDLYVRPAMTALMTKNPDEDFEDDQKKFVSGVKQTLERKLIVSNGVTHERLKKIAEAAEAADFSDGETLMILYKLCNQ